MPRSLEKGTLEEGTLEKRLRAWQPEQITPGLERIQRLLRRLGDPQRHLPEVIHVAGTNGKGSTIAFLQAFLEAAGKQVHVYTSPHLVRFAERIRVGGSILGEDILLEWLDRCEQANRGESITYFEMTTAMAFLAFACEPADFTLLETGMGGRLDATNLIDAPAVTAITRISFDHMRFLGSTLEEIAREKAGIMKEKALAVLQPQRAAEQALREHAQQIGASIHDWQVTSNDAGFHFESASRSLACPPPNLVGEHQYLNAATAIACLDGLSETIPSSAIERGLTTVHWPGRLQRLSSGPLLDLLPPNWELWLDGGHNDSAGEVLARQAERWHRESPSLALITIFGMLASKQPESFLAALGQSAMVHRMYCLPIPGDRPSFSSEALVQIAKSCGLTSVAATSSIAKACRDLTLFYPYRALPCRVLICGSLSLVGSVLVDHR